MNIGISVGINDVNYDVDQSKDAYPRFLADKYKFRQFN